MKQLKKDGWMIFRMRAMCASFLCFHLGISWQYGARHFMNYLVDGDIAINHWQWQMQAGATNPMSPIFRVYSPNKNIIEKDAELDYIHNWMPESLKYRTVTDLLEAYPFNPTFENNVKINKKLVSDIRKKVRATLKGEIIQEQIDLFE